MLGWTPQYLAKLLKGENFGLQPVLAVVSKLPEINARWFLTGQGAMIETTKYENIRKIMHETITKVLDLEKYMTVMSPIELRDFEQVVMGRKKADFSPETITGWEALLQQRNEEINEKFKAANNKSICRTNKVQK